MKKHALLIFFCLYHSYIYSLEKTTYTFFNDPIDVVIPCHTKDASNVERTIASIRNYIPDVRRIIVVSAQPFTEKAEWADERLYPFTKESIALAVFGSKKEAYHQLTRSDSRMGWLYQQFLKLFAAYYIPDISSNILVVDADVIFLKPIEFVQSNGAGLYAVRKRRYPDYFAHLTRLMPNLTGCLQEYSGVAHHMLFQKPVLDDLFETIAARHHEEPWFAIAHAIHVTHNEIPHTAMSEYEIYFNFAFARTDQVKIRPLQWQELINKAYSQKSLQRIPHIEQCDFIALHMRPDKA